MEHCPSAHLVQIIQDFAYVLLIISSCILFRTFRTNLGFCWHKKLSFSQFSTDKKPSALLIPDILILHLLLYKSSKIFNFSSTKYCPSAHIVQFIQTFAVFIVDFLNLPPILYKQYKNNIFHAQKIVL